MAPNEGELAVLAVLAGGAAGVANAGGAAGGAAGAAGVEDVAERLLAAGAGRAWLVSLGAAGAMLATNAGTTALPAPAVHVVDTVGAGDTLNGALAAGLAAGLGLQEAARQAVVAASLAVTRPGAREGMPTAAELEAALAGLRPR